MVKVKSKHVGPRVGYFEINNGDSVYRVMDRLNPAMNPKILAEFYESQKQKGDFVPTSSPLTFQIMRDAVNSKDSGLLNFLFDSFTNHYILTTSKGIYLPVGQFDEVIHNCDTSEASIIKRNLVGKQGFIQTIDNKKALGSFLGTPNIKHINRITQALNETNMYLCRLAKKPVSRAERFVGFSAGSGGLSLGANCSLFLRGPSFGYELVEKKK